MKAGLITIGDELLIGQTVNTNATWLGSTLGKVGITVRQSTAIEDDKAAINKALKTYLEEVELIIITGGLGPTNDDITKETLTEFFQTELELHPEALERVKKIIGRKGKELLETNIQQAYLPKSARILKNVNGTASGMWFEKEGKIVVSLPGVPYEMKTIVQQEVIPLLQQRFTLKGKYYKTLMVQGIAESTLADTIKDWEERIDQDGLHLAYLPSPGIIKLRLNSDKGKSDEALINTYFNELKQRLPQYVYGENDESIFNTVGKLLKAKNLTLGTIESCTGGHIAHSFVAIPGASSFFKGGLITYSNELKSSLADVSEESLKEFGAVSEEVAKEMAVGGRKRLHVDYSIAVTGIAGPDGGTKEKPVGTVWIAVATEEHVFATQFFMGNHRGRTIEKTGNYAVNLLRQRMLNISPF